MLVVTWTVDEGHALSRVLTPGKDSRNDYRPYTHNFAIDFPEDALTVALRSWRNAWAHIGPPRSEGRASSSSSPIPICRRMARSFRTSMCGRQIISEVQPKLVITTGTAGGIGKEFEVGDVVVSPIVRFDCTSKFKNERSKALPRTAHYSSVAPRTKHFATAKTLFKANAGQLPKDNTRPPKIVRVAPSALASSVVTTDFFGFDTSNNHYHLQGLGDVSEMGDAVLGLVAKQMGDRSPSLGCGAKRLGSADQGGGHRQRAGCVGRSDLQRIRPLEFRL